VSENYSFIYDELIDAYFSLSVSDKQSGLSSAEKALEYTELNKSRSFAASWGLAFTDGLKSLVPAELQERERLLLAQQAALQSELEESSAGAAHRSMTEVESALDAHKKEESDLIQQLRRVSPGYAEVRYPQPVALSQVPVRSDELLVEFKMLPDSVLVWMVRGSAEGTRLIAFYKVDRPRQWFEKRILSLRDAFNAGHPEQFDPKICEELFNSLFPDPFGEHLKVAQSVIFIPDDILFLLPLEMLSPHASEGQFVLLKTATEYFPSAAAFRLSRAAVHRRPSWREQFIGIADPITSPKDERYIAASLLATPKPGRPESAQHGASVVRGVSVDTMRLRGFALERLPGTATEVKSIADLFPGGSATVEVRTGMEATKQELMQTDLARFRFVHFATHGVLPVEAGIKEPALILSYDGASQDDMLLTLSEVFKLRLQADMVVLSACNTGSGKVTRAEGVASLGTAFLAAGASSATVSLWQVSDSSTAIFMQEFYRNLLQGTPKAAALALARSKLISEGYDNPFFWAPFVLTGE
jgi:CHAT domain-containing protein